MFRLFLAIFFFIAVSWIRTSAQEVKVHGRFYADSIKIGEVIPFSLTAHYPSALNVIFPDTTFSFAPFEIQSKKFFATTTKNNVSFDSVVYFLTTYEVDNIQTLRLPVFVLHGADSTTVESNTDTIVLKQMVHVKTDSLTVEKLPLKTNTDYFDVSWLLNYPLLLIIGGILIVVLIVLWIIFGKRILRHYKLKRMARRHAAFIQEFSNAVQQLNLNFSAQQAESVFVLWKKYMESLVSRPFTRYTAREIVRMEKDESLGNALRTLNMIIYGGAHPADDPFPQLQKYTELQFTKETEEVKHG